MLSGRSRARTEPFTATDGLDVVLSIMELKHAVDVGQFVRVADVNFAGLILVRLGRPLFERLKFLLLGRGLSVRV